MDAAPASSGLVIGRYVLFDEIAAGGMATVHLGRLRGAIGFARTVAIKRLHPALSRDADFTAMFMDEAKIAARIRHPNVVSVLDVVHEGGELFLVMDYVQGESLARLMRAIRPGVIPPRIAVTVIAQMLHGLHAAHEATSEHGDPLGIVHRDVSPQNVMVGSDGVTRVLDFGVAKAAHRAQTTRDGSIKGKISYMAPEQLLSENVDRRADVYAASVVLWEALTGQRLFDGDNQGRVVRKILDEPVPPPSSVAPGLPPALDGALMRGLERDVAKRWQSARELAAALEQALPPATPTMIGEWVEAIAGSSLMDRARRVKDIESRSDIVPAIQSVREEKTLIETPHSARRPILNNPTVPQAFAVMTRTPQDEIVSEDVRFSSAPPAGADTPNVTIPESGRVPVTDLKTAMDKALGPLDTPSSGSKPKLQIPSPFAPMPVQTLAITPLAKLDAVPVPVTPARAMEPVASEPEARPSAAPKRGRRMLTIGIVLCVLGLLAAAFAVTWTLLLHKQ